MTHHTDLPTPAWWTQDAPLERFVRDVLEAEMAQLRPSGWRLPAAEAGWLAHWQTDLGADSLELMALCSALADAAGVKDVDAAVSLYQTPVLRHWLDTARIGLAKHGQVMCFRTSGSSGTPKSCLHSLPDLMAEMRAMAQQLGPIERIVSAVRSHHIYGFLFTVLLPHALGRPAMPVLDLQGQPPLALERRLQAGDLVIGFPDWWRLVVRLQPGLPNGVVGITSTAPCPDELSQGVMNCGLQRLLHVYGSTETAGVGWRDWPEAGYQLHDFWQRLPGEAQQLRRAASPLVPGQSLAELQDQITWLSERRFVPGPRLDGAVQVGGVNVHLEQVRRRLCNHPEVLDAAVRVHSVSGQTRLKAYVVPQDASQQEGSRLAEQLQAWAQRHLAPAARPVHYTVGPALPRNAMGKACDWAI
jgi:long-chain acyl-CoA synthetase